MAGFSSSVYDCYFVQDEEGGEGKRTQGKKKKENKPLIENKKINKETGMQFNAIVKQEQ